MRASPLFVLFSSLPLRFALSHMLVLFCFGVAHFTSSCAQTRTSLVDLFIKIIIDSTVCMRNADGEATSLLEESAVEESSGEEMRL